MSSLLEGVRVVEVASLYNGDLVGSLLGDLGADVIKVEQPGVGDYIRDMMGQIRPHWSPSHLQINKNKRSLTLDLSSGEGRDIFFELLRSTDVFVDGKTEGVCDRLGIGYEEQRRVKPDIVYCQHTGFGSGGPYGSIPAHGMMMEAVAGHYSLVVDEEGMLHEAHPDEMLDTSGGGSGPAAGAVHAALHISAALVYRDRTGRGCKMDASAADAVIANGWIGAIYGLNGDKIADDRSMPGKHELRTKFQFYRSQDDRNLVFCGGEHKFWDGFCKAVDRIDLLERKDSSIPVDYGIHDPDLRNELQEVFSSRTLSEWLDLARIHHLPIVPANSVGDLRTDPQLRGRQILVEDTHREVGEFTYIGCPVVVSDQPYEVRYPAPALGEHTEEILSELGIGSERVAELSVRSVV